ncbi:MAG: hypothetical protein JWM80_3633 [Cyanobacteria bacterium RYN_339]|nr:hypothetical protein [Cyanobacteria bacterium RYN_339]
MNIGPSIALPARKLTDTPVPLPMGPDGRQLTQVDFAEAIAEGKAHRMGWNPLKDLQNLLWFAKQSHRGARWDFKNLPANSGKPVGTRVTPGTTDATAKPGQDFGNFAYGVIGEAMHLPRWLMLKAAGLVALHDGESKLAYAKSNFDIPRDQTVIREGFDYYQANRGTIDQLTA